MGTKSQVIVTGASTGIGFDTALLLASRGFFVHAGVRKQNDFERFAGQARVRPFLLDVTSEGLCQQAAQELAPFLNRAQEISLVNNAGIAVVGALEALAPEAWQSQMDVNVLGLVRVTRIFLPFLRAHPGRIVNLSSVSGLTAMPFFGPYAASKFAVEALSDTLRRELRPCGIKVIAVEPGPVATPIWEKQRGHDPSEELRPDLRPAYEAPLRQCMALAEQSSRRAVPVRLASLTVLRALTASRPRARYLVVRGLDAFQSRLLRLLPTGAADYLIGRALK